MRRVTSIPHLALLFLLLLAVGVPCASAQTPLGPPFQVNPETNRFTGLAGVSIDEAGNLAVLWRDVLDTPGDPPNPERLLLSRYSPDGRPGPIQVIAHESSFFFYGAALGGNEAGDLVAAWSQPSRDLYNRVFARRMGGSPGRRNLVVNQPPPSSTPTAVDVALDGRGNFVAVWTLQGEDLEDDVFAQRFDMSGRKIGKEWRVNTYTPGHQRSARVAIDPVTGNFMVVWVSVDQDGSGEGVFGQLFSTTGKRLGPEFRVNTVTQSDQRFPAISADGRGNFVVVWQDLDLGAIVAQRFDTLGRRLGSEKRMNLPPLGFFVQFPGVASDAKGNYVVAWDDTSAAIYVRLVCRNGTPTQVVQVSPTLSGGQNAPQVAFGGNGTFVVVWNDRETRISARRYSSAVCNPVSP